MTVGFAIMDVNVTTVATLAGTVLGVAVEVPIVAAAAIVANKMTLRHTDASCFNIVHFAALELRSSDSPGVFEEFVCCRVSLISRLLSAEYVLGIKDGLHNTAAFHRLGLMSNPSGLNFRFDYVLG
jgi:hypothetical protein